MVGQLASPPCAIGFRESIRLGELGEPEITLRPRRLTAPMADKAGAAFVARNCVPFHPVAPPAKTTSMQAICIGSV